MRTIFIGLAGVLTIALAASAFAAQPLAPQECEAVWKQVNPDNLDKVPEASVSAYITDLKVANPDGDGTIEKDEFSKACSSGLVKTAASTSKQPAPAETSDRTPQKHTPTPPEQVDTNAAGKTSDRTPDK